MQLEAGGDVIPIPTGGDVIPRPKSRAGLCWGTSKIQILLLKGHRLAYLFIFCVKFSAV